MQHSTHGSARCQRRPTNIGLPQNSPAVAGRMQPMRAKNMRILMPILQQTRASADRRVLAIKQQAGSSAHIDMMCCVGVELSELSVELSGWSEVGAELCDVCCVPTAEIFLNRGELVGKKASSIRGSFSECGGRCPFAWGTVLRRSWCLSTSLSIDQHSATECPSEHLAAHPADPRGMPCTKAGACGIPCHRIASRLQ